MSARTRNKNIKRLSASERFIGAKKNFLSPPVARGLRRAFDEIYADPRSTNSRRFVWDHWHLEDQYRLHRTSARQFLPPHLYQALERSLIEFGQTRLGCHSISEPWLSYYTDGDEQQLHTDSPHGPWAYVYSLTDWSRRRFTGGETLIMRPEILSYWAHYSRVRGQESQDLFMEWPPHFNQLLIFDPRLPHAVRRVEGVRDPRHGRLVVHGWFVNPEPFVTGALKMGRITRPLNTQISEIFQHVEVDSSVRGILTLRLDIRSDGRIKRTDVLTNTLMTSLGESPRPLIGELLKRFGGILLPKASGTSNLTLPLILD